MGKHYGFTYVENSSGYKKPASLYDGESYTTSSSGALGFSTNTQTNVFTRNLTVERGAIDGASSLGGTATAQTNYAFSNQSSTGERFSGSTYIGESYTRSTSFQSSHINNQSSESIFTSSREATAGDPISYRFTASTFRKTVYGFGSLQSGSYSSVVTKGDNYTETVYNSSGKNNTASYGNTSIYEAGKTITDTGTDGGGNTVGNTLNNSVINNVVLASDVEANGTTIISIATAAAAEGENTAEYTRNYDAKRTFALNVGGGGTTSQDNYRDDGEGGTTTFTNYSSLELSGNTAINDSTSSTTFAGYPAKNTKVIYTTGATTKYANQQTTETSSSVLGTFFGSEVTRRYTKIVSTETIEQNITSVLSSSSATDSWDDSRYDFLIDKTFTAVGGVFGFISNDTDSISESMTTSKAFSDAEDSYYFKGQSFTPRAEVYDSSSGTATDDQSTTITITSANGTTEGTQAIESAESAEYSYFRRDTETTGTNYKSHGFLDSTIVSKSLITSSESILWGVTNQTSLQLNNYTTTNFIREASPTRSATGYSRFYSSKLSTINSSSQLSTYEGNSLFLTTISSQQFVNTRNGSNITWRSIDNGMKPDQFKDFVLINPQASLYSYESMKFTEEEIAFCSVTDTDRESRQKVTPPELRYTEFFLTTTDLSGVTVYSKSTRTEESWFAPQAQMSYLNSMIYFPKDKELEIYETNSNSMSFGQDNQNTQIINATFSTVENLTKKLNSTLSITIEDVTRSTTSEFLRIFSLNGGLITREQPRSYNYSGLETSGKIAGGDNAYSDSGTAFLNGNCKFTISDTSGGSTEYTNNISDSEVASSTLPDEAFYISANSLLYLQRANGNNNYLLTSRSNSGGSYYVDDDYYDDYDYYDY